MTRDRIRRIRRIPAANTLAGDLVLRLHDGTEHHLGRLEVPLPGLLGDALADADHAALTAATVSPALLRRYLGAPEHEKGSRP